MKRIKIILSVILFCVTSCFVVSAAKPVQFRHLSAQWMNNYGKMRAVLSTWADGNSFSAQKGEGGGVAYISSSTGNTVGSEPVRGLEAKSLAVTNMWSGDAVVFTWPGLTLSAGASVDFMISVKPIGTKEADKWLFEYYDEGKWKSAASFTVQHFESYQHTTFSHTFNLVEGIDNADLKMRIRPDGYCSGVGIGFVNSTRVGCQIDVYEGVAVKDTKKVLVLGNSFTHYYSTDFMLKEIAHSQGHILNMHANLKGGQTFGQHCALARSLAAIGEGDFDIALLQDQSARHSKYYSDPVANSEVMSDTKDLVGRIRRYSPGVKIVIENTWSYAASDYMGFGSYERFDAALAWGAKEVCRETGSIVSPIAAAFDKAREEGIELYVKDEKHPDITGAYLKSCVNYLLLFGEPFDANVPDCKVEPETAAKLRRIAAETIFGK